MVRVLLGTLGLPTASSSCLTTAQHVTVTVGLALRPGTSPARAAVPNVREQWGNASRVAASGHRAASRHWDSTRFYGDRCGSVLQNISPCKGSSGSVQLRISLWSFTPVLLLNQRPELWHMAVPGRMGSPGGVTALPVPQSWALPSWLLASSTG